MHKTNKQKLSPNSIVKTCKYLEKGLCYQWGGLTACVHGSMQSPFLATTEDIVNNNVSYESIVNKRIEIFKSLNGFLPKEIAGNCARCCNVIEKQYKDVCFDYIGGEHLPGQQDPGGHPLLHPGVYPQRL